MFQAVGIQAVYADTPATERVRAAQAILIPAAKMIWVRQISTDHPKRTWRQRRAYAWSDLSAPFSNLGVKSALETDYSVRGDADWHLTGDPVGFQVTDTELGEMIAGDMPRNVSLRYLRALEAKSQLVLGAKAVRKPGSFKGEVLPRLEATKRHRTSSRLRVELERINAAVSTHDMVALGEITPESARARGAGPHRNERDLPLGGTPVVYTPAEPEVRDRPQSKPVEIVEDAPVAPSRSARAGGVKPGARITAKDGVVYVARKINADEKDLSDVEMYRRAAAAGMNVFLYGLPGTGKTRGLQAAFSDAIIVPISGDTEVADLVGSYQPTGPDTFAWIDGPLIVAMDQGRHIVLDEVGLMDPKVAAVVYPLMDGRRELLVTANPLRGTVHAKDGFSISGTTNPDAPGVRLSEALLSRFHVHIEVGTDYSVARGLGVNERIVQAAEHLAKQYETGEVGWAPQMRELLVAKAHEETFGLVFALRNLIASVPAMEREVVEQQFKERFGDIPGAARKVRALKVD